MNEGLYTIGYWLVELVSSAPLLGTLIAGLLICYRQHRRRPRVSKLIGWALLAEFVLLTVGVAVQVAFFARIAPDPIDITNETDRIAWMWYSVLLSLPASAIQATIWGTALWAVLGVEDRYRGATDG